MADEGQHDFTVPEVATNPGRRYFEAQIQTLDLFHFIITIVLHTDYSAFVAKEALDGRDIPQNTSPKQLASETPGNATLVLRQHRQRLLEMIFSRIVDNFTTYISELLRDVLTSKPEILRSKQEVRLDYVLKFASLSELISDLVDRKVSDLGYLGFAKLEEWCAERMGLDLIEHDKDRDQIIEIIETRNLITHNRGKIGSKYLKQVVRSKFNIDEIRKMEVDYLFESSSVLISFVKLLDTRIATKFSLKRNPMGCRGLQSESASLKV